MFVIFCIKYVHLKCLIILMLGSCSNEITCKTWKCYNNLKLASPAVVNNSNHTKFWHLIWKMQQHGNCTLCLGGWPPFSIVCVKPKLISPEFHLSLVKPKLISTEMQHVKIIWWHLFLLWGGITCRMGFCPQQHSFSSLTCDWELRRNSPVCLEQ